MSSVRTFVLLTRLPILWAEVRPAVVLALIMAFALLCALLMIGTADAEDLFVRPGGGSYLLEDGSDYLNAFDGFGDVVWGAGEKQVGPGDTLWVCGPHGNYSSGYLGTHIYLIPTVSGESGSPITVRMDCSTCDAGYEDGYLVGANRRYVAGWTATGTNGVYKLTITGSCWIPAVDYGSGPVFMNAEADFTQIATWSAGDWDEDDGASELYVKPLAAADPNPNNDAYMTIYGIGPFSLDNNNVDYFDIKNCTFYGGYDSGGAGMIDLDGCDYINVDNCEFYDGGVPMRADNSDNGTFTNNVVARASYGPYLIPLGLIPRSLLRL